MPDAPAAAPPRDLPLAAPIPFPMSTFSPTWGVISFWILFPATATALFGDLSGSHPAFFLAAWSPGIAAFVLVAWHCGRAGPAIGVTWGVWHLPAFHLAGLVQGGWALWLFFFGDVVLAVAVTPLFDASGGSILWPILFHWRFIDPLWPDARPWDTMLLALAAIAALGLDRHRMPQRGTAVPTVLPRTAAADVGRPR